MPHPPRLLDVDRRTVLKQLGLASAISTVGLGTLSQPAKAGLGNGLVAHYQLNNLKRNPDTGERELVKDASKNHNDGIWFEPDDDPKVNGKIGNAFKFEGDDSINIGPLNTIEGSSEITIALWAKQSSNHKGSYISKNGNSGLNLQPWSDGNIYWAIDGKANRAVAATPYPTREWYHIVGWYDGSTLKIYVNGEEVASSAKTTSIPSDAADLLIGEATSFNFEGSLDDVYIYNRALDKVEICQLYLRGVDLVEGLQAYYPLNEINNGKVEDASENDNTGTVFGDPVVGNGQVDGGLVFDGNGDYVEVPHDASLNLERSDSFSIATWVNFNDIGDSTIEVIVAKRMNSAGFPGYLLWKDDSDQIQMQLQNAPDNRLRVQTNSAGLNNTEFFHIAVTYDGSTDPSGINTFINGDSHSHSTIDNSLTDSISHTDPLRIARQHANSPFDFNGVLDEIYIFNRALSDCEIQALANIIEEEEEEV